MATRSGDDQAHRIGRSAVNRAAALAAGAVAVRAGFALVAYLLIDIGPDWLTKTDGLTSAQQDEARGRVRTALFALLAGVIALVDAIYTGRTFALNRHGQITERFTRAIDQLDHDRDPARRDLRTLERIAHESRDEHGPIMEVLTAYVREQSSSRRKLRPARIHSPPCAHCLKTFTIGRLRRPHSLGGQHGETATTWRDPGLLRGRKPWNRRFLGG